MTIEFKDQHMEVVPKQHAALLRIIADQLDPATPATQQTWTRFQDKWPAPGPDLLLVRFYPKSEPRDFAMVTSRDGAWCWADGDRVTGGYVQRAEYLPVYLNGQEPAGEAIESFDAPEPPTTEPTWQDRCLELWHTYETCLDVGKYSDAEDVRKVLQGTIPAGLEWTSPVNICFKSSQVAVPTPEPKEETPQWTRFEDKWPGKGPDRLLVRFVWGESGHIDVLRNIRGVWCWEDDAMPLTTSAVKLAEYFPVFFPKEA